MYQLLVNLLFSHLFGVTLFNDYFARKMSFGRMNDLGQFISEFDRDPDMERKKGRVTSDITVSFI